MSHNVSLLLEKSGVLFSFFPIRQNTVVGKTLWEKLFMCYFSNTKRKGKKTLSKGNIY